MRVIIYTMLLVCYASISSCKKDFLDIIPGSQVSSENFYKTESDFKNAVNAAYSNMQEAGLYGSSYSHLAEVPSDNVGVENPGGAGGRDQEVIDKFQMASTDNSILQVYTTSYSVIQRCNIVTDRIVQSSIPDAAKNVRLGEVQFIRALVYFNLVRFFGDVPLILVEIKNAKEGYEYARAPKAEVYAQIIKDLKEAEQKLPVNFTGTDIGRATRGAAKALLGKVYLTQKDFPATVAKLQEIINSGTYALAPSYGDNFDPAKSNNVGHKESIFEIQYKGGGTGEGSNYNNTTPPNGAPTSITTIGGGNSVFMFPTKNIVDAHPAGDLRKRINVDSIVSATTNSTVYFTRKYLHSTYGTPLFAANDGDNNWPVLRYADVLLMYAEAVNEVNNVPTIAAYNAINMVRRRAYGLPVAAVSIRDVRAGISKQDFFLAVENERRLEFAFEGHRWLDLTRTDRAIPVMSALRFNIKPHHVLFPIPQSEIDVNPKITQNTGY